MKKYKHIPTGRIYTMDPARNNRYYFNNENDDGGGMATPRVIVESGKDWEEVKDPPTFEIMSLATDDAHTTSTFDTSNRKIYENKSQWIKYYLESKRWKIYSVKRLSDGEIFTIGDKWISNTEEVFTITRIYIGTVNNNIYFDGRSKFGSTYIEKPLQTVIKYTKKPLFTTEDGVNIYEGDGVYSIETSLDEISEKIAGNYKHSTPNHPVEHRKNIWYRQITAPERGCKIKIVINN